MPTQKQELQFLAVPTSPAAAHDPYTTPRNNEAAQDLSGKANKALQAPRKRDEVIDETLVRKNRAYDPSNLQVRAFRLESSPSDGEGSTENSSQEDESAQISRQWTSFTQ